MRAGLACVRFDMEENDPMNLKFALIAVAALGGVALSSATASAAMPNGLPAASAAVNQAVGVDQVRYVCDAWGQCWWRPNYYAPRYHYGPRHYGPPRHWGHHHQRWGHHHHRHWGHHHHHRHWGHHHGGRHW
jgi:hypothetical protein